MTYVNSQCVMCFFRAEEIELSEIVTPQTVLKKSQKVHDCWLVGSLTDVICVLIGSLLMSQAC